MSSVGEFIFSPLPSLLSSSGGVELTKSKNTFRKIDISAFRFSLATFSQVRIISPRFSEEEEERRTNNMRYTIMHEQLNLHILYVGKTTGERHRGSSITRLRQSVYPENEKLYKWNCEKDQAHNASREELNYAVLYATKTKK